MKYCPICENEYPENIEVCPVDGATLRFKSGKQDSLVGSVVKGRYRVIQKLGEGGMGAVYLAEQVAVSRKVALKWLHSDYARDEDFVKRFRQEAKLAAALSHRNVVTIFDFDQADDGSLYIVMEYVNGKNLAEIVREGPMEVRRALRSAVQIAEGLMAAHRAGVIHRDVKPENVMVVGAEEEIKLMDFGISRLRDLSGTSRLTRSGTIMGTPAYMAPEQIEGAEVSEGTDIYAFGIVLYEMLTGSVPFQARTPGAVLVKHLKEPAQPLRKIRREVPVLVERVVSKALEKDVQKRQASMQEVVESLREAQRHAETQTTGSGRSLAEPLAGFGLRFGSAAAKFKGLFGKGAVETSGRPQRQSLETQGHFPEAQGSENLGAQTVLHDNSADSLPRTGEPVVSEFQADRPAPTASPFEAPSPEDVAPPPPSPAQESESPPGIPIADATVVASPTLLQTVDPEAAAETVIVATTRVEPMAAFTSEFANKKFLTEIEGEGQVNEARPRQPHEEAEPIPQYSDIATGSATVATTVVESASVTIGDTNAPAAVKSGRDGGFRRHWLTAGGIAAAVFAAVVYFHWRSDFPSQEVAVVERRPEEVVAEAPRVEPPAVIEKPAAVVPAEPAKAPQTAPFLKSDRSEKSKPFEVEKKLPEKKLAVAEAKAVSKTQEAGSPPVTKPEAKSERQRPVKEPPTEVAALKPIKPLEPPAPVVPEARLVSLSVLSDKKELDVNTRMRLSVRGKFSDGKENEIVGSIRWESSDGSVAAVNSRGELEARKEGTTQITATYSGLTSPSYTFYVKGAPQQPEKAKSADEGIQDLRRRLLR